ncbi:MAG: pilus assembly protein TadG-related protein [Propionibacteriaceae bacterium]|jgi:Flp pilus assembly protein TadG|nr:pilus assembly protein TadG-related protein [Propionibacteriaceae bacterium]
MGKLREDKGQSYSVWTLGVIPVFILIVGLVVDVGGALGARMRAFDVAEEAARAAAQRVALGADTGKVEFNQPLANKAARDFAKSSGLELASITYEGEYVRVKVRSTWTPVCLSLVGFGQIPIEAEGSARGNVG